MLQQKRFNLIAILVFMAVAFTSCIGDSGREFLTYFCFYNDLDVNDSIFVEYKSPETNNVSLYTVKYHEECSVYTDSYFGTVLDKLPPDDFVFDKLNNFTIYRFKDNNIQYLSKEYYDEPDDFKVGKDVFFSQHDVKYSIVLTEEMFQ